MTTPGKAANCSPGIRRGRAALDAQSLLGSVADAVYLVDEDWFVRRDGTMVPVAYSSAPLPTATGRGAVVAFREVSDRLAAEEMRRRETIDRVRLQELASSTCS